ncbi:MAG: hypothetical protein JXL85_05915 [Bacilli bacterium]|nr:hypothetical protein [Bacilli bacterium]
MSETQLYQTNKGTFKNLSFYLKQQGLIDENNLWIAGFIEFSDNHPWAANLFYGNKRLVIITYNKGEGILLNNTKHGLVVRERFNPKDIKIKVKKKIIFTWLELQTPKNYANMVITKNKDKAKDLEKKFKEE